MARSATIWAAALLLAGLSGSGPMLTTAEAMPAPGPQETAGRPRYYFPRHVKRMIVTNSTAPAASTSSSSSSPEPSSSSSTSNLELRQSSSETTPFWSSVLTALQSQSFPDPALLSSSQSSSISPSDSSSESLPGAEFSSTELPTTTANGLTTITSGTTIVTVSLSSPPAAGTGNPEAEPSSSLYTPPAPVPTLDSPSSDVPPSDTLSSVGSTGGIPFPIVQPTSTATPSSDTSDVVPETSAAGSSGGIPRPIVQPTSSATPASGPGDVVSSTPAVGSSGGVPGTVIQPTSSSASASESGPLSSSAVDATPSSANNEVSQSPSTVGIGSTGGLPNTVIQPTSTSAQIPLVRPTSSDGDIGSTGSLPGTIIQPTSTPVESTAQDHAETSPISSTGAAPSEIVRPTDASSAGSTGAIPGSAVLPSTSLVSNASPSDSVSTGDTTILGPFIIPGSTSALLSSVVQPSDSTNVPSSDSTGTVAAPTNVFESDPARPVPTGSSGGVPSTVVLPTNGDVPTSDVPSSLPTSGIVVGITTAFGTSDSSTPTLTDSAPIPTSESKSETADIPILSSTMSQLSSILAPSETVSGVVPSSGVGITDPTAGPTAPSSTPPGITPLPIAPSSLVSELSSLASAITSDVESLVSSLVSEIQSGMPTGTAPIPNESVVSSIISSLSSAIPTTEPVPTTDAGTTSGVFPPSATLSSGTDVTLAPSGTSASTGIPVSEETSATLISTGIPVSEESSATPISTGIPVSEEPSSSTSLSTSDATDVPFPTSSLPILTNSTAGISASPASTTPVSTLPLTSTSEAVSTSSTLEIPFTPSITPTPSSKTEVPAITATGTDSETTYNVGTKIIQEPSSARSPTPTATTAIGIPSELPKMILPPNGISSEPPDSFFAQVGFKWPLNYPFVFGNDGGNQIFKWLPPAIADALNISQAEVVMKGLKPLDTTQSQGFITTLALFYIPADLNGTLAAQMRNPADALWHNIEPTVNQLTSLINPSFPLAAGGTLPENEYTQPGSAGPTAGGVEDGGAIGADMRASHRVNPTSAGIATGAVMGAIAYGAAMFFVARRYRNKKMSHKRTSSVPTTSRHTYGSMQGGAGAFMSGGRGLGRSTPGGRDSRTSRGSSSSQGRSVRTQQISAPVMAENSLGWN